MNKTRKRAIQKHRAKARKFDALRKTAGNQQPVAAARPASPPRARPAPKPTEGSTEPQA